MQNRWTNPTFKPMKDQWNSQSNSGSVWMISNFRSSSFLTYSSSVIITKPELSLNAHQSWSSHCNINACLKLIPEPEFDFHFLCLLHQRYQWLLLRQLFYLSPKWKTTFCNQQLTESDGEREARQKPNCMQTASLFNSYYNLQPALNS